MYGLWPGVACIATDADLWCVPCAYKKWGKQAMDIVINGYIGDNEHDFCSEGDTHYPSDSEGNPIHVILNGSEDAQNIYCRGYERKPHNID